MRIHRLAWLVLALLPTGSVSVIAAQTPQTASPNLVLRFQNGSVIQPLFLLEDLEIQTKFGKVSIPANEVRRIDFGFRITEEDAKKIEQALRDLGSNKFPTRTAAGKTLQAMGRLAYPAMAAHIKGADLEVVKRLEPILQDLRNREPPDRLKTRRTDIVRTSDSTVTGQLSTAVLRCRCELFGEMKLQVWQLRDLFGQADTFRVAVDAAKYGHRTTWLDTGFDVTRENRLDITAKGEVNLDPNNVFNNALFRSVQPDGHPQLNTGEGRGGVLMGRIGTDGPAFVVGSRYSMTPQREGKLFLRIITYEPSNNVKAQGSYQVEISTQP